MKFTPREPREGVNVSKEHPLVEAGTLIAGLGLIFVAILLLLIFLVEIALYFVPEEKEVAMFSAWLPEDISTVAHDDPRLVQLEGLVERLSGHWPDTKYRFWVEISDSSEMNAMALPGGLIIITTGLLDSVRSENELAFVVGHELGHFRNRDHIRGLGRGVVLAMLLAAMGSGQGGDVLTYPVADLTLKSFSRRQESAADRFALELVHAEYGHVAETWAFFERIGKSDGSSPRLTDYLQTHPQPGRRVEAIIEHAGERGWSINGSVTTLEW